MTSDDARDLLLGALLVERLERLDLPTPPDEGALATEELAADRRSAVSFGEQVQSAPSSPPSSKRDPSSPAADVVDPDLARPRAAEELPTARSITSP